MVAIFLLLVSMSFWMFVEYEVVKKNYTNNNKVSRRAKMNNVWLALVALFCFIALYTSFFMRWHDQYLLYWSCLGSLIAIGGLIIRRNAIKTLGKHFDGLLQLKENQKLIQHGLYRYFRHPSYTGTIIAFFGFGISSMSFLNTILFPVLFSICYVFRMQLEEELLENAFGEEYEEYKTKTWGLLPWFKKSSSKNEQPF